MYELTFSVEKSSENLLKYMYNVLLPCVQKVGGVIKYLDGARRSRFALACNDLYASTVEEQAKDCLCDVLTLGFKGMYVRQKLNIDVSDFWTNALVNTICVFDNKFDKNYVKKIVNLDGEVCIDGYYNFKLQRLKSKWDELVAIVNSNVSLLGDASLIKDFLCYLIDFLPSTQKELSIVVDDGSFRLFNQSGRLLPVINLICPSTLEDQVVINAICIKPQNVKLYCDKNSVCSELLELLNYLFDVKIVENS